MQKYFFKICYLSQLVFPNRWKLSFYRKKHVKLHFLNVKFCLSATRNWSQQTKKSEIMLVLVHLLWLIFDLLWLISNSARILYKRISDFCTIGLRTDLGNSEDPTGKGKVLCLANSFAEVAFVTFLFQL